MKSREETSGGGDHLTSSESKLQHENVGPAIKQNIKMNIIPRGLHLAEREIVLFEYLLKEHFCTESARSSGKEPRASDVCSWYSPLLCHFTLDQFEDTLSKTVNLSGSLEPVLTRHDDRRITQARVLGIRFDLCPFMRATELWQNDNRRLL